MRSVFGPIPNNPVNIEPSIVHQKWPRFDVLSNNNFTLKSPFVPYTLSRVNVKPTSVIKLLYDHPNLSWERVKNITSRPLAIITKGPEYVVTRNFTNSVHGDKDFRHCLSRFVSVIK